MPSVMTIEAVAEGVGPAGRRAAILEALRVAAREAAYHNIPYQTCISTVATGHSDGSDDD